MAVTRDGIPVRCWTFPGNQADTRIIRTIKDDLDGWQLRRLVWVADRGFASAANRAYLTRGGGHYIHAEKLRHTNTEAAAALARAGRYRRLKLRPVFHYREDRIRAHVQLCWLALLLIRVAETGTGDTWRTNAHELDRMHLVTLATSRRTRRATRRPDRRTRRRSSPPWNCPNRPGSISSPPSPKADAAGRPGAPGPVNATRVVWEARPPNAARRGV